jgi:hypothetical protein
MYVLLALVTVVIRNNGYEHFWTEDLLSPVAYVTGTLTVISLAVYIIDGFRALED